MDEIRAFLSYSFNEEDSIVVGKFKTYLTQVSGIRPNFKWQDAERATPETIDAKVLRIMKDQNVFIGICTAKECIVDPVIPLQKIFGFLRLNPETTCKRKTSDWIIQEIGLAYGLGMPLILLVEHGVREPGNIQGNVQRITFERDQPEKSFGKILEMIKALSGEASTTALAASAPEKISDDIDMPSDNKVLEPCPSWSRKSYEFAYMHYMASDMKDSANHIAAAYLKTDEGKIEENIISWNAYEEFIRIYFNKGGKIKNLKEIARNNPQNEGVLQSLAKAHQYYKDHIQAATIFQQISAITNGIDKLRCISNAAREYTRAGEKQLSDNMISQLKSEAKQIEDGELVVLETLGQMAGEKSNQQLQLALLERAMELNPNDNYKRFDLAYMHSENDNEKLALMHYIRIDEAERTSMAWNNLGVAFDNNNMPARAVQAYRHSEKDQNTLAMSNLANKLIKAGFLEESEALCKKAMELPECATNVLDSLKRIKEIPSEEGSKEDEVVAKVQRLSRYYARVGEAAGRSLSQSINGRWKGESYSLDVKVDENRFEAIGYYEVNTSGGLASLFSTGASIEKWKIVLSGKCDGAAVVGKIERTNDNQARITSISMLGRALDSDLFLIAIAVDENEMEVLENPSNSSSRSVKFVREHSIKVIAGN